MKISKNWYDGYVYDISVRKNENLFVNGILSHNCGAWVAKKRYAVLVWDDEGVRFKEPQLKVTGIEIVRSSTPGKVKPLLKDAVITLMKDAENIVQKMDEIKAKFMEMPPEDVAFPRTANNVSKFYDENSIYRKGTPIGVRAALIYNAFIKKEELAKEFKPIQNGDKIKFLYMRQPNPAFNSNVFGFTNKLPKENLSTFVDYKTQYEKTVENVIRNISDRIGISLDNRVNLNDLF